MSFQKLKDFFLQKVADGTGNPEKCSKKTEKDRKTSCEKMARKSLRRVTLQGRRKGRKVSRDHRETFGREAPPGGVHKGNRMTAMAGSVGRGGECAEETREKML